MSAVRLLVAENGTGLYERILTEMSRVPGIELNGVVRHADQTLALAARFRPHVVVLDAGLAGEEWRTLVSALRSQVPAPEVVICESGLRRIDVSHARLAGAFALLSPQDVVKGLLALVRQLRLQMTAQPGIQGLPALDDGRDRGVPTAARRMRELFASMSHHVRTPLNGVLGLSHALKDTSLSCEQGQMVENIRESADRLARLVDDLFDLVRCESGDLVLEGATFEPREMANAVVGELVAAPGGLDRNIELLVSTRVPVSLTGDSWRIRKALAHVLVTAMASGARALTVEMDVSDAAAERLALCFRVSGSDVKGVRVNLANKAEWNTSHLVPMDPAAVRAALGCRLLTLLGATLRPEGADGETTLLRLPVGLPDAPAAPHRPANSPPRVLVVDDEPINQLVAARLLIRMGVSAEIAANGREAVERARSTAYDLIIMDVQMPGMDGLQATREIRRLERGSERRAPIVALTASMPTLTLKDCIAVGMDDLVRKPVRPEMIAALLRRWTGFVPVAETAATITPRATWTNGVHS